MEYVPAPQEVPFSRMEILLLLIESNKRKQLSLTRALELVKQMENPNGIIYTDDDILNLSKMFYNLAKFFGYDLDAMNIDFATYVESQLS